MSRHTLIVHEPHPTKPGHYTLAYASVDVAMSGSRWHWRLQDLDGKYTGNASAAFSTEDQAKDDALNTLGGTSWD